ncbi:retrovirus-related pol polyprotein from transposon TNT 1-94 [Tanacetum coccineum]
MMLNSIDHGPLVYGTIEESGVTRNKTYEELTDAEKLQDNCDVKATNIILQERECKLYDDFDRFTSVKGESLHEYYLWFAQLMNDMHIIGMTMQQVQVNTKFLNTLPPEWSKFLTDVKLARNMHTTNYDQLYAYLSQHEAHATEVRLLHERFPDPLALIANNSHIPSYQTNHQYQYNPTHYQQQSSPIAQQYYPSQQPSQSYELDSGLAVLSFLPGDDPITSLNKAMRFLTTAITSCFPKTNNQLRTSSNPRNQITIQDARVTIQQVQGRQGQSFDGMRSKSNATSSVINRNGGNNVVVQARIVRCYNYQGEGHMAMQCTQPKRPRNSAWFKEKILLVQAQEAGQELDEEQLAFLADPEIDDLDAFDSDCDEAPCAKAVLMANISRYDSNVISEVPILEPTQDNYVLDNCVLEMYYSKQPTFDPASDIEITSDSNIISYDQYLKETESAAIQNTASTEQQNGVIMSVFKEITNRVAKCNAKSIQNKNVNESLTAKLERYKERVRMFEERQKVDLNDREKYIESQMNDMILNKNAKFAAFQKEIDSLKFSLSKNVKDNESLMTTINVLKNQSKEKEDKCIEKEIDFEKKIKELENIVFKVGQSTQTMHMLTKPQVLYDDNHKQALGYQNPFNLKKAQRIKATLYDGAVISRKHDVIYVFDSKETLNLAEESRSKMLEKQNDLVSKEKKVNISPMNYSKLNKLMFCRQEMFEIQKKELLLENDRHLELIISQDLVHTVVNSLEFIDECESMRKSWCEEYNRNLTPKAELSKMNELSKTWLDLEPLSHRLKNNREAHEDYLQKTKEHTDTLRGIIEQARKMNPSDPYLEKKLVVVTPMNKTRKVRSQEPKESSSTTHKQAALPTKKTNNTPLLSSTGVIPSTSTSGSQSKNNTRKNRITLAASSNKNNKTVEAHPRKVMYSLNKKNHVSLCNANFKHDVKDANSKSVCSTCNGCLFSANHDKCVVTYINDVNKRVKSTGKVFTNVGHRWLPTERTFTINGTKCPMTRITSNPIVPPKETSQTPVITSNPEVKVYRRRTKVAKSVVQIVLWYLDLRCSKHMTGQRSHLINFVEKFIVTVIFGDDHIAKIMGYGDYQIGNVTISWVYYVEGLVHNLFSVDQFCDSDLEVAFQKHTCFVQNFKGADLLTGSRDTNLYTLSLADMMRSSPICLLSKASKTKSWLRHRRLSHLNFATINELAKQGLVRGLPKLKYEKDHLCYACSLEKSKKHTHKPKSEDSIQEKLYLLHMDLCGPMRIESINGKKYILVIFDDYSRFTWVKYLRSKDETPEFVIKFLKMIQVRLNTFVRNIRTDNGTEFVNQTLKSYYEDVGISHQTSIARTSQQNDVVERQK